MATRSSWRGAVEVLGFPVNVELHNRVKSKSSDSFKMLGTDEKPVKQVLVESGEFAKLEKDGTTKVKTLPRPAAGKGVEIGPDTYKVLTAEAINAIQGTERSTLIQPTAFVPRSSIPFDLTEKSFNVIPDTKVVGSERSYEGLYSGLRHGDLAYTTEITVRAGSRDAILVIYATEDEGLRATTVPFADELSDAPTYAVAYNEAVGEAFGEKIEAEHTVGVAFDHDEYVSEWRATRKAVIEKVLDGVEVVVPEAPKPAADGPSLMDALVGGIENKAKPKKAPAKKRTTKAKVKA